jgi:hypothetical protein
MSFSDCGLPVNQPPFLALTIDVAARLVLLSEVGQRRLKTGFEGRRCDLYGALCSWRAGVQDVIRSHPNLVLADVVPLRGTYSVTARRSRWRGGGVS